VTAKHEQAPLFVRSFDLAAWLHRKLADSTSPLAHRAAANAVDLLELVALALRDLDRVERVLESEERVLRLRAELRLLLDVGALDERAALFALGELNAIGTQLLTWRRSWEAPRRPRPRA
jgi:hypothetical protein